MDFSVIKANVDSYFHAFMAANMPTEASLFSSDNRYFGTAKDRVKIELKSSPTMAFAELMLSVSTEVEDAFACREAKMLIQIIKDSDGTVVKSLSGALKAIEMYLSKDMINGWLYYIDNTGAYMPYLLTNMRHVPAEPRTDSPAQIRLTLEYNSPRSSNGGKQEVSLTLKDVHDKTVPQILASQGYFKENLELYNEYVAAVDAYDKYASLVGAQFWVNGAIAVKGDYSSDVVFAKKIKAVNDEDNSVRKTITQSTRVSVLKGYRMSLDRVSEEDMKNVAEESFKSFKVPFHPHINMFGLDLHKNMWVLASKLELYEYDKNIVDKLILPEDHRDLVDILVHDADVVLQDIVSNKSGGTNILCKGPAGLGKTLTAEVYSEMIEKPLYSVHSGQLGNSPNDIDKKLKDVLDRAKKWGAILMLDECDVYVRKRDNSMEHNAIVAAFLRQLERHDGILFLTTNRSDDVDDAIKSRCIAMIDYTYPDAESLTQIWKMLSKHYNVPMSDDLISKIVVYFDNVAGRDVKELLKLVSKYISQREAEVDFEVFRKCAMFRGLSAKQKKD